jgi:MFS family permease
MTTQIGYALGLLFIIPLGDLYKRKNIIVINFLLLSVATCSIAMSVNVFYILLASLVTGICSVMPQIFIPIAAQFSLPQNKARNARKEYLSTFDPAFLTDRRDRKVAARSRWVFALGALSGRLLRRLTRLIHI